MYCLFHEEQGLTPFVRKLNKLTSAGNRMKLIPLILLATSVATLSTSASAAGDAKHFPGVFIGATHVDGETDFSYGIEYEYKFSKQWGAGFVYEKTDDAHHGGGIDIMLASAYLHPWKDLRLGLGFGKETVGSYEEDDGHGHYHHHASHKENVVRASVSYDFHVGDFGVAPTFAVDFVDGEEAYVFGVALIKPF